MFTTQSVVVLFIFWSTDFKAFFLLIMTLREITPHISKCPVYTLQPLFKTWLYDMPLEFQLPVIIWTRCVPHINYGI